ncbi:MAG: saccharopine dehydrogenase NADP-binding domain-containing protein [Bacteroidia bacterium]|nr:saccharopine dehydrogenase NADP-binding domain-containing protein [Bacteroidia bacterium]
MSKSPVIFIAGAGGIGSAAAVLLREIGNLKPQIYLGDINLKAAKAACNWVMEGSMAPGWVRPIAMPAEGPDNALQNALSESDILLDCLPGSLAPQMARLALENDLHYANLTEYVAETEEIQKMAARAKTGFILQTGLAPGYIGVLANHLFQEFCKTHGVERVETIEMKVGALTDNAVAPHYYGFTWSPIGVATEYVKDAIVVRNGEVVTRPSLSERRSIILNGIAYEEDLTSGGAADLPQALSTRVRRLDYKTLRYPGHYAWVEKTLKSIPEGQDLAQSLEKEMLQQVPRLEADRVVLYASVEGKDLQGTLHRSEVSRLIPPLKVGGKTLRAIQSTTASALCEAANLLHTGMYEGVILQSEIKTREFLHGPFITAAYGK